MKAWLVFKGFKNGSQGGFPLGAFECDGLKIYAMMPVFLDRKHAKKIAGDDALIMPVESPEEPPK